MSDTDKGVSLTKLDRDVMRHLRAAAGELAAATAAALNVMQRILNDLAGAATRTPEPGDPAKPR